MTIPASAQGTPITAPNQGIRFVDDKGYLTNTGRLALQEMHSFIVSMNRVIPCNASTTLNTITLTMLDSQPQVNQYVSYDQFGFVADATTNGNVSAVVVTEQGTLTTLNVYKANGATRAGSGDVVSGSQYFLTYVDSLNANAGGFVLR